MILIQYVGSKKIVKERLDSVPHSLLWDHWPVPHALGWVVLGPMTLQFSYLSGLRSLLDCECSNRARRGEESRLKRDAKRTSPDVIPSEVEGRGLVGLSGVEARKLGS
jgi:hypothetical protein